MCFNTIIKYYFGELILKLNSHCLCILISIGPQSTNYAGQTIIKSAAAEFNNFQQITVSHLVKSGKLWLNRVLVYNESNFNEKLSKLQTFFLLFKFLCTFYNHVKTNLILCSFASQVDVSCFKDGKNNP